MEVVRRHRNDETRSVVEACVLHGLKRRIAGLLCTNKVAALFMKMAKSFSPAEELCQKVQELEQLIENRYGRFSLYMSQKANSSKCPLSSGLHCALKHLWIRTALMEKLLDKIVLYLVENSSTYYEREAMLMDPVDGPILASLLVGPCALEYTKVKTTPHPQWTLSAGLPSRRPALIQKRQSSGSIDDRPLMWVRDYVESLHQNSRATLLFGKNNVLVQPRDDMEAIPGYLSLHQTADLMTLKWTPNQLMNGNVGELDSEKSVYWDYAMTIRLEEIVYLHCHQQVNSGGTVVLVSQDGIQRPPLHFPKGGHLLQFLTCLETGLLPHGQLDPPLWNQRGKGKVFPKLRKRSPQSSCDSVSDKEEDEATDYVFRILFPGNQMEFMALELMDQGVSMWQPTQRKSSCSSCSQNGSSDGSLPYGCNQERAPLKLLCDTMKYQIISRAFYGWLAYCRHLSTVRTHLSALVNTTIVDPDVPADAYSGLSVEVWGHFLQDSSAYEEKEIHRLVYFGGVAPSIRKEVWPFLLGHYHFSMTEKCRLEVFMSTSQIPCTQAAVWLTYSVGVRPSSAREREKHAEALARCLSGASLERGPVQRDSTISTDIEPEPTAEGGEGGIPDEPAHAQSSTCSRSSTQVSNQQPDSDVSSPTTEPPAQSANPPKGTTAGEEPMRSPAASESAGGGSGGADPAARDEDSTTGTTEGTDVSMVDESQEQLDMYLINLHRIDKDVRRCDRTYWYFTPTNLEKLLMCGLHLDTGYVQGMCDLLAPLLVILDDEVMAFSCFTELMKRMNQNFPHGGAMDSHFANMRSLIQILDSELFELMQQNGDYTHFYFCYRWFLLDFKREMVYDDVFSVWETIWAAKYNSSEHFVLFIALALVEMYRDIILENNMDFTDIIKFFNEMAERHNVPQVLAMARDLVHKVQTLIENK
uniref:Small G protein signaling modulator 1b n=1 Tax=Sphaeramia orbicularis TaxID=375764 RepID=A0A672ZHI7_9TELE